MSEKMITLHIPEEWFIKCKQNFWKYKEVFGMGIKAQEGMPSILGRINALEEQNKRLMGKLRGFYEDVARKEPSK